MRSVSQACRATRIIEKPEPHRLLYAFYAISTDASVDVIRIESGAQKPGAWDASTPVLMAYGAGAWKFPDLRVRRPNKDLSFASMPMLGTEFHSIWKFILGRVLSSLPNESHIALPKATSGY